MTVARIHPFLQARASIATSGLVVTLDGREVSNLEDLEGWDPASRIEARCEVSCVRAQVDSECGLEPRDGVVAFLRWQASGTRQRGVGEVVPLSGERVEVGLRLPGERLGGTLTLQPVVALLRRVSPRLPGTAGLPGSVLWQGPVHRVHIEGSASRFPVDLIDFRNARLPERAGWYLQLDLSDLRLPVAASVRLLVNRGIEHVRQAVTAATTPSEQALAAAIRADVARQLIASAVLAQGTDLAAEEWPEDSIGRMLVKLIDLTFPQHDPDSLRQMALQRTTDFDAQIQAIWLRES